jgi:phosphohistidine phosphatase
MTLYLVQHGEATLASEDPERPLTARGHDDVARLAVLLARTDARLSRIEHSGKRRARETAEILAAAFRPAPAMVARSGLAPDDSAATVAAELAALADDTMLVGHLPHLGRLAALLLVGREEPPVVAFTPGTLVRLERGAGWTVAWAVPPAITGRT